MKMYGTKRILPVYGDSRPVERRINNQKIAGWKEVIPTGESISQVDTYNDSAYLKIKGKSQQAIRVGKNLIPDTYPDFISSNTKTNRGITFVKNNNNNSISISGTQLSTLQGVRLWSDINLPIGTYTLSGAPTHNVTGLRLYLFVSITRNGTSIYYSAIDNEKITFTVESGDSIYLEARVHNGGGTTYYTVPSGYTFYPQIEAGSTATTYEQYGISPSPEYPSVINSVSNFDLVSSGKNLFNVSKAQNQAISDMGTIGTSTTQILSDFIPVVPGEKYHFKTTAMVGSEAININRWVLYDANKNFLRRDNSGILTSNINYTIPSDCYYLRVNLRTTALTTAIPVNLLNGVTQLERGDTATAYEPFIGMQTINFPYTLRSLPDGTKDYIEIDNIAKTAKLIRNIKEVLLNGVENWTQYTPYCVNGLYCAFFALSSFAVPSAIIGRNSHVNIGIVNGYATTPRYEVVRSAVWVQFPNELVNSVVTLQSFLDTSPMTIQYQLDTPTVTEIDYNEVKTYYPFTQIYTNAEIQPTLDGSLKIIDRGEE